MTTASGNGWSNRQVFLYFGWLTLFISVATPTGYLVDIQTSYMLKNQLHATATQVSTFRLLTAIPAYLSFIFGLLRDRWNPLGLKDRGFFLIFAPLAAIAFIWMAVSKVSYGGVLFRMLLVMLLFRFVAAAYQGLIALIGQEKLMSGRLSALWNIVSTVLVVASAFASGYISVEHWKPIRIFMLAAGFTFLIALLGFWKPTSVFRESYNKPQARGGDFISDVRRLVRHRAVYPAVLITFLSQRPRLPSHEMPGGAIFALTVGDAAGSTEQNGSAHIPAVAPQRKDMPMAALHSDAFVLFGATGDLAYKEIFPSLQGMVRRGHLDIPVIGVAKSGWNLDQLRGRARESVEKHGGFDPGAFAKLCTQLQYIDGDYRDRDTFDRLRQALGKAARPIHYLAIPPSMFATVAEGLAKSGCAENARIIVEKPFGRDLASAQALNRILHEFFPEPSIWRIDHFLGKEAVQNLLYFRFANSFLEPIWNSNYVSSVQVTLAESFGIRGRGRFYEEVGAIRDVIQNHMLQVLALLAMDAPVASDAEAMRDERLRLFKAIRPLEAADVVRGQFRGYRNEEGVAADSQVETFAAVRLHIDTWRWSSVPFFIRAGKNLPITATEVLVRLKRPPQVVFDKIAPEDANYFRFRLSPNVIIATGARVKAPGEFMAGENIELVAKHQSSDEMMPYERLLGDAIRGDASLFGRQDGVEAAWRLVDPILGNVTPIHEYDPNTWGPADADRIIDGAGWHNPA